jgi:glyoxylase-like metal-dependent hydrolase (beta-lactamase superfamily II)
MEIVKGVYQIQIPLTSATPDQDDNKLIKAKKDDLISVIEQSLLQSSSMAFINVYLIEGKKGNLLIDTGWNTPVAYATLTNELKKFGFECSDITNIVSTHLHPDHYGLAGKIKQLSGAEIALGEIDSNLFDARYIHVENLLEQMVSFLYSNGVPRDEASQLCEASMPARQFVVPTLPDVKLKAGKKISIEPFEFKVILTPGHSPGHICLYEPKRKLLFVGDHVLPEITPHIGLHPQSGPNPLGEYIESLKSLLKLEVNLAFPGHGPVYSGLQQRIEELLYHHEQRQSEVLKAVQNNMKTAYQTASEITWKTIESDGGFDSFNALNKRLAIMETLAHLQELKKQDKVTAELKDGIYYWA